MVLAFSSGQNLSLRKQFHILNILYKLRNYCEDIQLSYGIFCKNGAGLAIVFGCPMACVFDTGEGCTLSPNVNWLVRSETLSTDCNLEGPMRRVWLSSTLP